MKWLKHLLAFLVYSNLFIASCAVLMTLHSARLLTGSDPGQALLQFVFFSTICSYSFHYFFTTKSLIPSPRIHWQEKYRYVLLFLFFAGLAGALLKFLELREHWPWLVPAVVATFLYSAPKLPHPLFRQLRKVAIGKTIFLAFIWMYVTTVLPVVVSGRGWTNSFTLYAISRFFFIYCICILFDYRDRADDRAEGVKSLITFLSDRNITRLYYFSLLVYVSCTFLVTGKLFSETQALFLLLPGLVLAFLYNYARRHFSDILYYVLLDGLMALSALLMLVARI